MFHEFLILTILYISYILQAQDDAVRILQKLVGLMYNNTFEYVRLLRHAKVPIIRSKHSQLNIEFDISIYNILVCLLRFIRL